MINIKELTEDDIGKWVTYKSQTGSEETGRLKSWNEKYIFVVYSCDNKWSDFKNYTSAATKPEFLEFKYKKEGKDEIK